MNKITATFRNAKNYRLFYLLSLILVLFVLTKPLILSTNDISRFGTIKSLVEEHTFALDTTEIDTVDKIYIGENYYSSKPPLLSVLGAGIYFVLHEAFGADLTTDFIKPNLTVYIINLILVGGSVLILAVTFYKALEYFLKKEKLRLFLSGFMIFGTLIFTYIGTLNNHLPSAAALFLTFYFLLKQITGKTGKVNSLLAGIFLSLVINFEPLCGGVILFPLLIFQLFSPKYRSYLIYFIIGLLPLGLLYLSYNWLIVGSPLPPYFFPSLYQYPDSYWFNPWGPDALQEPKYQYAFNLLIGTHGLFLYSPVLLFLFFSISRIFKTEYFQKIENLILAFLVGILLYILLIIFSTHNYGGSSYGTRWFICFVPLLFFLIAITYPAISQKHYVVFTVLLIASVVFALLGYLQPWYQNSFLTVERWFHFPLLAKLIYFMQKIL